MSHTSYLFSAGFVAIETDAIENVQSHPVARFCIPGCYLCSDVTDPTISKHLNDRAYPSKCPNYIEDAIKLNINYRSAT